jgi:hypothetical protein
MRRVPVAANLANNHALAASIGSSKVLLNI